MKRVVFVQIGTDIFAIEIGHVAHLVSNVKISGSRGKEGNPYLAGMIRVKGKVIPALDLCKWLGKKPMDFCEKTVFVVMRFGSKYVAFPIDAAVKSCDVPDECFYEIPDNLGLGNNRVFKEVIDWEGALYLKISAEVITKKLMENIKALARQNGNDQ
ncbi:MAG: chemotaxis protein CheW [Oscillospiraceae bacterium]|nr:chemotaxis protein CheW [Oscillospiraceae bacterium]